MKIAFTSTSGQGKTTLVNELKKLNMFKDYVTPSSIQRLLLNNLENFKVCENASNSNQIMINAIACYNLLTIPNLLGERSLICSLAYTKYINEDLYKKEVDMYKNILKNYDYIFYLPYEIEIEKDGVRSQDNNFNKIIDENIQEILNNPEFNIKYFKISGTIEERIEKILNILKN